MSAGPIAIETVAANDQHYESRRSSSGSRSGRAASTRAASGPPASRRSTPPRRRCSPSPATGRGSGTAWACSTSAAAGARCPAGSPSASLVPRARGLELGAPAGVHRRARPPKLEVVTADVNTFETERRFDRVVSVEMFEHMRNWRALLAKRARAARARRQAVRPRLRARPLRVRLRAQLDGPPLLHRRDDAVRRPAAPFVDDLVVRDHWRVDGTHYPRTAKAWLQNLDSAPREALAILGTDAAMNEWRAFFLACAELFGYAAAASGSCRTTGWSRGSRTPPAGARRRLKLSSARSVRPGAGAPAPACGGLLLGGLLRRGRARSRAARRRSPPRRRSGDRAAAPRRR